MDMRFLPIIQSFLVQIQFILYSYTQETKFLDHIWAWAWHIAHLAQRSKNSAKVSPIDGVFRPNKMILKLDKSRLIKLATRFRQTYSYH